MIFFSQGEICLHVKQEYLTLLVVGLGVADQ